MTGAQRAQKRRLVSLTGIKPTGTPHLGNLVGAIRPALELARGHDARYFIADYHALTALHDPLQLRDLTAQVAATWLAFGLDPATVTFYRQSDVPQTFELAWVLACMTPKGLLNRAHAYKAQLDQLGGPGAKVDDRVNTGLFTYPVLMAADILLFSADVVPVGRDQKQHVEIARDVALRFNKTYGEHLVVPEPLIQDTPEIPGVDGRKMSKSYANTIALFAGPGELGAAVRKVKTDTEGSTSTPLFVLFCQFAPPDEVAAAHKALEAGSLRWSDMKTRLTELLGDLLAEPTERYARLMARPDEVEAVLREGAASARAFAAEKLAEVREAIGIGPLRDG